MQRALASRAWRCSLAASRTTPSSSKPSSSLDLPVSHVRGVGPESVPLLARLGIRKVGDLLWHLPHRYKDFSRFRPLSALVPDQEQSAIAVLGRISTRRTARGTVLTEAELRDEEGRPTRVRASWFGRSFVKQSHREGERVRLSGKVGWVGRTLTFTQPAMEPEAREAVHTGRLVPVYPLTEGLKEGHLRRWLHTAVEGERDRSGKLMWSPVVGELAEPLPEEVRTRHQLPPIADALRQVHFPEDELRLFQARRRLAFDELLVLQLALAQRRARWTANARARPLRARDAALAGWIAELPFTLTSAQRRALAEIRADLARAVPMSRLLEGDVGSGKTVVAALAARIAVASGAQAALMAPTELLAEQHARTIASIFGESGPSSMLVTSSVPAAQRREALERLEAGRLDVVIGTHALVEEGVKFARLALAIVDEQHRFGVRQRATFREKGTDPHLLLTTATPIPQTLSQTIYRDLDLSVLDEMPSGHQDIRTEVRTPDALLRIWPWLRERVVLGEQAFVVCPRIDPADEEMPASWERDGKLIDAAPEAYDVPSVVATEEELRRGPLSGLRLGLLHGRMPSKERDAVMRRFAERQLDVLVATTVVEVGIDITHATVMVVLGAERFGLAQLHQLRGRVGRRGQRAFCVLVSPATDSERLAAMTATKRGPDGRDVPLDGFDLAKRDLEIRGAGEFLGERQSGVPELRIVDLADVDPRLVAETASEADGILASDAHLSRPEHAPLAGAVDLLWKRYALA